MVLPTVAFKPWNIPKRNDLEEINDNTTSLPKIQIPFVEIDYLSKDTIPSLETISKETAVTRQLGRLNPVKVPITSITSMTPLTGNVKEIVSIKFQIADDSIWQYEAGDAFGICCENDPKAVDILLGLLNFDGEQLVYIKSPIPNPEESLLESIVNTTMSIRKLLTNYMDIMHFPKKSLLRNLAEYCSDELEKRNLFHLASKAGSADYMKLANAHASFVDFLYTFTSCKPSLECLVCLLPLLYPRYYSICSATRDKNVEFIYSYMDFKVATTIENEEGLIRRGVCSGWLERRMHAFLSFPLQKGNIAIDATVNDSGTIVSQQEHLLHFKVFPKPSPHFRLPTDLSAPLIMIGAGTGVSPFIGFLRTLAEQKIQPKLTLLFFGFKDRSQDFLFKEELENFVQDGILTRLCICTSREPNSGHPKYVQDAIKANSKELYTLMTSKEFLNPARIYICGDQLTMVKDVNMAIQAMIKEFGKLDDKETLVEFNSWNADKRIIRDIWI